MCASTQARTRAFFYLKARECMRASTHALRAFFSLSHARACVQAHTHSVLLRTRACTCMCASTHARTRACRPAGSSPFGLIAPTCLCLQASTHACGNLSAWLASLAGPCGSLPGGSRFAPLGTCVPCCWRCAAPWVAYAPLRRTYTLVGISYSLYMGLWGSLLFWAGLY